MWPEIYEIHEKILTTHPARHKEYVKGPRRKGKKSVQ